MRNIEETFKNWDLNGKPYHSKQIEWLDLKSERTKIYNCAEYQVQHISEPKYSNEHYNAIEVVINQPFMIMEFGLGGCVNMAIAVESAQTAISKILS